MGIGSVYIFIYIYEFISLFNLLIYLIKFNNKFSQNEIYLFNIYF